MDKKKRIKKGKFKTRINLAGTLKSLQPFETYIFQLDKVTPTEFYQAIYNLKKQGFEFKTTLKKKEGFYIRKTKYPQPKPLRI